MTLSKKITTSTKPGLNTPLLLATSNNSFKVQAMIYEQLTGIMYVFNDDKYYKFSKSLNQTYGPFNVSKLLSNITYVDGGFINHEKNLVFFQGTKYYMFESFANTKLIDCGSIFCLFKGIKNNIKKIDGAFVGRDGITFLFTDNEYYQYSSKLKIIRPQKITEYWKVPTNLDSVYVWSNGNIDFFKDLHYYRVYQNGNLMKNYPKRIDEWLKIPKQNLSLNECKEFLKIAKQDENKDVIKLLTSEDSDILDPIHKNVHHDMTRPLTDYFINSSHNTYLLSDQLVGTSSTKAYDNALRKGCKTLELDCWDGENNEPIVYHGFTLTTKILFKDVIDAIAFGAFLHSDYPVILSFENHCSPEQQVVMAKYLKEKLGSMLYAEDPDLNRSKLPSPDALKRKVFIKAKKRNQDPETGNDAVDANIKKCQSMINLQDADIKKRQSIISLQDANKKKRQSIINFKIDVAEEFSDIINYVESISFKSLDEGLASQKYFQNVSLGEKKLLQLGKDYPMKFIEYSNKFLVRTYPKGSRVDSSNYNPTKGWVVGCQLVALNFQTPGEMMDINDGLFALNGKCGYVLKPECLRNGKFDPQTIENSTSFCKVNIKIISGHFLPNDSKDDTIPDPFVRINVHGIPKDEVLGKFATKKVMKNVFYPQWNEDFQFDLYAPELAHIRFAVCYNDMGVDDYIAQYSIPFSAIRTGNRRVPLLNRSGDAIPNASLLVFVQKNLK